MTTYNVTFKMPDGAQTIEVPDDEIFSMLPKNRV
jgi:hypothetical protein